ncbi:MAG: aspartate aminotransferase family protein [Spirochaetae bacterium HGW-Spirochaetae-1]|jgi:acetylornithine/succinyldiaminopimelate/putrescine aminotransferase|nr:MAG: aspartate aminotransferase family protein [Spirochaetae bacterium HGW-Spirochaetae-1]
MKGEKEIIIDDYARHISPGKVDLYRKYGLLLVPRKRSGCYLQDREGKKYFNCHCNGGVFNLGHRNHAIIKALTTGLKTYDIGNHHLISEPKTMLARALAESLPRGLDQVVYGVSGGEAVDLAIKLARGVTGRGGIVSARGGYHGHTGFALAAGDKKYREKFRPMAPGFSQVPFDDTTAMEKAVTQKTAAVILETIPATMGIAVAENNYFRKVKEICQNQGALLILDEVQTGFGRTGKLWGFEHFRVVPDIVVLGKGMSGGIYPMSATIFRSTLASFFKDDPFIHISTFGGSEVGCFAALETLRISREPGFLKNVKDIGAMLKKELGKLSRKYPRPGLSVRGLGLMMGLAFKDEITSLFMLKLLFDRGIYLVYSGNDPRVLQFLPPLIMKEKDAAFLLKRIESALKTVSG